MTSPPQVALPRPYMLTNIRPLPTRIFKALHLHYSCSQHRHRHISSSHSTPHAMGRPNPDGQKVRPRGTLLWWNLCHGRWPATMYSYSQGMSWSLLMLVCTANTDSSRTPALDLKKDPRGLSESHSSLSSRPTCQAHGDGCDRSSSPFSALSYHQTTRAPSIREDPSQAASCSATEEAQAGGAITDGHSSLVPGTRVSMIATSSYMLGKPVRMRLFRGMMVSPKRSSLPFQRARRDDGFQ